MYVLVDHHIRDPKHFWSTFEALVSRIPEGITLHHTIPTRTGTCAFGLWEADSIEAVQHYLEPDLVHSSRNEYAEAENREGVAFPSQIAEPDPAVV
jgi:hypothetical protein